VSEDNAELLAQRMRMRWTAIGLALLACMTLGGPPARGADACRARFSDVACYLGPPQLALTRAVIDAGGGSPATFHTTALIATLEGSNAAAEEAGLVHRFGQDAYDQFLAASDFAIQDGAGLAAARHVAIPAKAVPPAGDHKALAAALAAAGTYDKQGDFDIEYMIDHLLSHPIHEVVMDDIDAKLGKRADAYYHAVFAVLIGDLRR
jgi:hypothetical protein